MTVNEGGTTFKFNQAYLNYIFRNNFITVDLLLYICMVRNQNLETKIYQMAYLNINVYEYVYFYIIKYKNT